MRGPGDLEGTQQSGLPIELSIASLAKDGQILSDARDYASHILEQDPDLSQLKNRPLLQELQQGEVFPAGLQQDKLKQNTQHNERFNQDRRDDRIGNQRIIGNELYK